MNTHWLRGTSAHANADALSRLILADTIQETPITSRVDSNFGAISRYISYR